MSRFDIMRSWVRAAADLATDALLQSAPMSNLRQAFDQLRGQQASIDDQALGAAVAHADNVVEATVSCRNRKIYVDATTSTGADVQFSLRPTPARFAPRGAKEIGFEVEPTESLTAAMPIVAVLAGLLAKSVWPMFFVSDDSTHAVGVVDRDGSGRVRVDLRSVPPVRKAMSSSALGMVAEVLEIERLVVETGRLLVKLKVPQLLG